MSASTHENRSYPFSRAIVPMLALSGIWHLNNATHGDVSVHRRSPPILSCENSPKLVKRPGSKKAHPLSSNKLCAT